MTSDHVYAWNLQNMKKTLGIQGEESGPAQAFIRDWVATPPTIENYLIKDGISGLINMEPGLTLGRSIMIMTRHKLYDLMHLSHLSLPR